MHRIVTDLLADKKYDGEVRPNIETGQPVVCLVNFRINSMSALRETSMVSMSTKEKKKKIKGLTLGWEKDFIK